MSVPLHTLSVHFMFCDFAGVTKNSVFVAIVSVAVSIIRFLMVVVMAGDFLLGFEIID